jgi:hypothetical protein
MGKKVSWWALVACLAATLVLGGLGCGELGKVDQGRVIAFDNAKATVTFINDVKHDPANPDYSGAPMTFSLPTDPADRGEDPKAGKRMKLDPKAREITIYDTGTQSMKKITYTLIDQKEGVGKDDPLVKGKKYPLVEKDKKAITIYSSRQKLLTNFALPDDTWEAGDEVRVYYKEPGKCLRFMNITRTDIFKK